MHTTREFVQAEKCLLKGLRRGDPDAFAEFVRLHSSKVYGISLRVLKNREDAEDNLQNVFCKACRNIRKFQGQSQLSTWLFRIAINEALMKLRKRQSERTVGFSELAAGQDDDGVLERQDLHPDPERQCIAADLAAKALRNVDPSLGDTFFLNKAEGWTNRELARTFGTTAETIKSRIFRTRLKLRREILVLSRQPSVALQA